MMISYIFLLFIKEESPNPPKEQFNYSQFFKRLSTIIKSEKNYRNFLVFDSLLMLANMSHAFFTVYAFEKFYLSDGYAGTFTIVMMISIIIGSIYFGYVADKLGHKRNLIYASGFTAFACAAALLSPFVELYFIVFIGSALNLTLLQVSRLTIIAEICIEEDRPTYIALSNLVTAPFVLSGIFGGLLVKHFGYHTLFIIAGLFALASLIWLVYMVQEPRPKNTLQTN
jgi:MFS family permease